MQQGRIAPSIGVPTRPPACCQPHMPHPPKTPPPLTGRPRRTKQDPDPPLLLPARLTGRCLRRLSLPWPRSQTHPLGAWRRPPRPPAPRTRRGGVTGAEMSARSPRPCRGPAIDFRVVLAGLVQKGMGGKAAPCWAVERRALAVVVPNPIQRQLQGMAAGREGDGAPPWRQPATPSPPAPGRAWCPPSRCGTPAPPPPAPS